MIGLVLVAAGSGQRLGAGVPKALVRVAGRSMIEHCLRTVSQVDRIGQVVVVAPPGRADDLVSTGVIPEGCGSLPEEHPAMRRCATVWVCSTPGRSSC